MDFILAGVPAQQPCYGLLLNTNSLGLPHYRGQVNGWRGHGELLKFSQWPELRLQQQEVSWPLHWCWGWGWEAGEEYGIQCSGSQMFSSHNNSGNTHTALRAGHAVDKGIANTSCPLLWKGEMKKEEWIIN